MMVMMMVMVMMVMMVMMMMMMMMVTSLVTSLFAQDANKRLGNLRNGAQDVKKHRWEKSWKRANHHDKL